MDEKGSIYQLARAYSTVCEISLTFGGPVTNIKGEVLDKEEEVIQGLCAVVALVPGFFFHNYPAGSALARNVTFGRIAGRNA